MTALQILLVISGIMGAILMGAIIPGPSFLHVARTSITSSRRIGLAAALGMGAGGVTFAALALVGLQVVIQQVPTLYIVLKGIGGLYLAYIGWCIWRSASQPLAGDGAGVHQGKAGFLRAFALSYFIQASNPKAAIVYAGVFAALMPAHMPLTGVLLIPLAVFTVETLWYLAVVLVFSSTRPRAAYLRAKAAIDRLAGGLMALLGIRLIVEAVRR
jgi:threonine/homoserine/homoserine lactone efflux protein